MTHLTFGKIKLNAALAALVLSIIVSGTAKAQTAGDNVYFDPSNSGTTTAGGSGDFSTSNFYDPTTNTDAPFMSGTNEVGNFVPGEGAIFDGPASTVSVSSAVDADYLEVGVTSGTETFGTAGNEAAIELPIGNSPSTGPNYNQPQVGPDFLNPIQIDAGSENVVFNSDLNLGIINHYYSTGAHLSSSTTGNVTFNGGITITNNTSGTDNVGNPTIDLDALNGGSFTINSAVSEVDGQGAAPITNGNVPSILLSTAGSTLTLTSNASFSDIETKVYAGTTLDQGATYSSPVYGLNYKISVGGSGQYLTDAAGVNVSANVVFNAASGGNGGTIGGALANTTTFSGQEIVGYNGGNINLTAAAGGRVNFTGDVHNGNGYSVVKTGAGTIAMNDTQGRAEDQSGAWEIQNGTFLVNGSDKNKIYNNSTVGTSLSGSGVQIDQVATSALAPNAQTYATLGGTGDTSVAVTAVGANSSITPGDPTVNGGIGTLGLSGGLTASSGATFNFTLNGAKANGFDTIAFNGSNLTLGGTVTFNFTNIGGALDSGAYNLLTGFSPLVTGGSLDTAAFILNAPTGYVATLDPSDLLPNATNFAVDFTEVAIPEPSTYAMMFAGLVALAFVIRRKSARFQA